MVFRRVIFKVMKSREEIQHKDIIIPGKFEIDARLNNPDEIIFLIFLGQEDIVIVSPLQLENGVYNQVALGNPGAGVANLQSCRGVDARQQDAD